MTTAATLLTADDLWNMPDNAQYELVRGELRRIAPTSGEHGIPTFNLPMLLGPFIRAHGLGVGLGAETGFLISRDPDTVLAPDCAFVRADRVPPPEQRKKFWPVVPDLVVEVLSPSDSYSKVVDKVTQWLEAGTRLVWIVDPEKKTLTVHAANRQPLTLRNDQHISGEDVLPGFDLCIAEIFK